MAENFLRTAVMVALADQDYSASEDKMLQQYCQALGLKPDALDVLELPFKVLQMPSQLMEQNQLGLLA